jgi:hypothetical protein
VEDVPRQYPPDTRRAGADGAGEARLRVPDAATADRLIEDKLWLRRVRPGTSGRRPAGQRLHLALGLSVPVIQPDETDGGRPFTSDQRRQHRLW